MSRSTSSAVQKRLIDDLFVEVVSAVKERARRMRKGESVILMRNNHRFRGRDERSVYEWERAFANAGLDLRHELEVLVLEHIGPEFAVRADECSGYLGVTSDSWLEVVRPVPIPLTVDYRIAPSPIEDASIASHPRRKDVVKLDLSRIITINVLECCESRRSPTTLQTAIEKARQHVRTKGATALDVRVLEEALKHRKVLDAWSCFDCYLFPGTVFDTPKGPAIAGLCHSCGVWEREVALLKDTVDSDEVWALFIKDAPPRAKK